jgi:hypothetical protein
VFCTIGAGESIEQELHLSIAFVRPPIGADKIRAAIAIGIENAHAM